MAQDSTEQIIEDDPIEVRRAKREALLAEGKNPYGHAFNYSHHVADLDENIKSSAMVKILKIVLLLLVVSLQSVFRERLFSSNCLMLLERSNCSVESSIVKMPSRK